MRVLLDARSVFPGMGGIGRATRALAQELPRHLDRGDELLVLRGARAGEGPITPAAREVHCEAGMIDPCFEQVVLPGLLEELEVDLFHGACFAVPLAGPAVARVATVHDVVFRRHPQLVDPALRRSLDQATEIACAVAERVVTVSVHAQGEIATLYGRGERVDVVPNGVDPAFARLERRRPGGAPYLLYVGALEAKKNVPALLRGFEALVRRAPELPHQLVLVGGRGGQSFDLEVELARLGEVRGRVHVLGHVPEPDLCALYAAADGFVYLSAYEGFGLPPLEAMAAGVPTLVADRAALPEVVGEAALLVDPEDAERVGAELHRLLTDAALRQELARAGHERASGFRWEASARRLVEIYREVMAERAGGAPRLRVLPGGKHA